jgi:hypothetical protein
VIVHLKNSIELQDAQLEGWVETIFNLNQQLLELHLQAPPAPKDLDDIDVMSGIDED